MSEQSNKHLRDAINRANRDLTAMVEHRLDRFIVEPGPPGSGVVGILLKVVYPRPYKVGFPWPWQSAIEQPTAEVTIPGRPDLVAIWTERLTAAWKANGMERPDPVTVPGTSDHQWWKRRSSR